MRTFSSVVGVACSFVGATLLLTLPGGALEREAASISRENPTFEASYDPIVGQNPGAEGVFLPKTPRDCATAAYCDSIPVNIDVPAEYDAYSVFAVAVEVSWEDPEGLNDVDVYLHYPDGTEYSSDGATGANPEKTTFVSPAEGTWYIVINNFSGPNTGYTLKLTFLPEEDLGDVVDECDFANNCETPVKKPPAKPKAPAASSPGTGSPTGPSSPPPPTPVDSAPGAAAPPAPGLTPVDVADDGGLGGVGEIEDRLGITDTTRGSVATAASGTAPAPVSGATVAAWFVGVPLVAVGSVGTWLWRRNRRMLELLG